jgi:Rrf2 family protein
MRLGKASAYAVFATLYIAEHQREGPVSGRRIAEAHGIPPEYLLKILQQLVRAGVVQSETGRRGGFLLCKSPGRTTLLEIVEAVEGPLNGGLASHRDIQGADGAKQRIEALYAGIDNHARAVLRRATVRLLANG